MDNMKEINNNNNDAYQRLKGLIFFRVLFISLLLGSTIVLQIGSTHSLFDKSLLMLYGLIFGVAILSICYAILFNRVKRIEIFSSIQIGIDTLIISCIIFVTGCFSSIFSFLYLVVIIYSTMLLYKKGSMIIAALCAIQYGIIVELEYFGFINPFPFEDGITASSYPWNQVQYKIIIITLACISVAFLSNYLAEQARKTKSELLAMKERIKRFEKMAAMGEMAARMAHEIKNPIASISGSIQLLTEDMYENPQKDRLMRIIHKEADRLGSLVNNYLLFARPPIGKIEKIELGKSIIETIELFEKDSKNSGKIIILKDIAPNVWTEMYPVHLHQILWNLLLNASEAIETSGNIKVKLYSIKNKSAVIEVADDGCGITDNNIKSIYDPFFTTKPKGTGLGLSIVLNILKPYESWLEVESKINVGSVFMFKLKQIDSLN